MFGIVAPSTGVAFVEMLECAGPAIGVRNLLALRQLLVRDYHFGVIADTPEIHSDERFVLLGAVRDPSEHQAFRAIDDEVFAGVRKSRIALHDDLVAAADARIHFRRRFPDAA